MLDADERKTERWWWGRGPTFALAGSTSLTLSHLSRLSPLQPIITIPLIIPIPITSLIPIPIPPACLHVPLHMTSHKAKATKNAHTAAHVVICGDLW